MRVLIATPYFWPRIGGLENYARQTALYLAAHGWDVHVVASGPQRATEQVDGLTVHYLKSALTLSNTPINPLWLWQARRLIRTLRPDVINVHAPVPSMALAVAAAAGRTPLVVTYHAGSMKKGRLTADAPIALYERVLLPWLLGRAKAVICASDFVHDTFLQAWRVKSTTITPGVDLAQFTPDPSRTVPGRIVFVGDFRDPRKGLEVLLQALKSVPAAHLHVVGYGDGRPQEHVTYRGVLRGANLVREFQEAELLVLPSTTDAESFGMVLLEAMACGLPVIGSNVGGIGALVHDGENGRLVPPGDAPALAVAISELLESPKRRQTFGAAGRTRAEREFGWDQRGVATDTVLRAAATAPQPRVFLLHNIVAPYRLPVFEEVGRNTRLDVYFGLFRPADRKWSVNLGDYHFNSTVLPSFKLGPFILNPTLLWHLIRRPYDQYLVGDFPELALATFTVIAVAKLRRKPVVLWSETTAHDVNYYQHLVTSPRRRDRAVLALMTAAVTTYRHVLLRLPDQHVALSQLARTFLLEQGVPADQIASGIQVMPRELLAPPTVAKADGPYAGKQVVLSLGYLNHLKALDKLIRAFQLAQPADTKLVIAGSGPAEAELKTLAAGDPNIVFFGYANDADRANLMSWADVFVLPTLVDCWGMVVNEGLHYETPVITTTAAGAAELLSDGGGIVLDRPDDAALAGALSRLLGDQQLHQELTAQAVGIAPRATDPKAGAEPIIQALQKAGAGA